MQISFLLWWCAWNRDFGHPRGPLTRFAMEWSTYWCSIRQLKAVQMIQEGDENRSKYAFLIKEIKEGLIGYNSSITHIVRSKNNASHLLSSFGWSQCRIIVWLGSDPDELLNIASGLWVLNNTSIILQKKCCKTSICQPVCIFVWVPLDINFSSARWSEQWT